MKKIKIQCHSVLRYGISKILVASTLVLISANAFADMSDCVNATKAESWNKAIEYCKPLADENNKDATGLTARAYTELENGIQAQKYFQIYADKYGKTENNFVLLGGVYASLGNAYYFGAYGAKKDIKKGLEYITKGAQLGNSIAQEQLGNFYAIEGEYPTQNVSLSYMWFNIAWANGEVDKKGFKRAFNTIKQQQPYCIAMGQQLVTQSYIEGTGGLSKNDNQARQYLIQAIELYKEAKKPSEDELEYCPKQKGLDLASAEKLLKSL